jgi:C1A family cysteine protease
MLLAALTAAKGDTGQDEGLGTPEDLEQLRQGAEQEGWTYTIGETPATLIGTEDLCGLVVPDNWRETARFRRMLPEAELPTYFNWCDRGACPPVRHQGRCGSCWAFASTASLESNILIKDGIDVDLSEQWLISCNRDGWGCGGGWVGFYYLKSRLDSCGQSGAVSEDMFPYRCDDVPCGCPHPRDYWIHDWAFIGSDEEIPRVEHIKYAMMMYGPIYSGVCVNSAFAAYTGGIFNGPSCNNSNHAVSLVGWDDEQGANGVWILRNVWGAEWGEDGYMRIEYGTSRVGEAAAFIDYRGTPAIRISLPDSTPRVVPFGKPTTIEVRIHEIHDAIVGTGMLHYSTNGGIYEVVPLAHSEGETYIATLPVPVCSDTIEYYFSAEGLESGPVAKPRMAPVETYSAIVGGVEDILTDDFETDKGWTVANSPPLTAGAWIRATPEWRGSTGDPPADYDGSGKCYLTGRALGEDVDGGYTWLMSPTIDLTGGDDAWISFAIWYTNNLGYGPNIDVLRVYVSNDDGATWTSVRTVGPMTSAGWKRHNIMVSDHLVTTDRMRVRFEASDCHVNHHVEAAVDDFRAGIFRCTVAPDPNMSTAELTHESGSGLTGCPAGDGPDYEYLKVSLRDTSGAAIGGMTADHIDFSVTPAPGCSYVGAASFIFKPVDQVTGPNGEIRFTAVGASSVVGDVDVEIKAAGVRLAATSRLCCKSFDIDLSGLVDLPDLLELSRDYGTPTWRSDFNWDGAVNRADYNIFKEHYWHGMPEPPPNGSLIALIDSLFSEFDGSAGNFDLYNRVLAIVQSAGIEADGAAAPTGVNISPNPSASTVGMTFDLARSMHCSLRIYDVKGRLVSTLADHRFTAGSHTLNWNGRDSTGRSVASGIYFCRLQLDDRTFSTKVVLGR